MVATLLMNNSSTDLEGAGWFQSGISNSCATQISCSYSAVRMDQQLLTVKTQMQQLLTVHINYTQMHRECIRFKYFLQCKKYEKDTWCMHIECLIKNNDTHFTSKRIMIHTIVVAAHIHFIFS